MYTAFVYEDSSVLSLSLVVEYWNCGSSVPYRFASARLVNSSWTGAHIKALWGGTAEVLYPPTDLEKFKSGVVE
jgi:hypothetical protein